MLIGLKLLINLLRYLGIIIDCFLDFNIYNIFTKYGIINYYCFINILNFVNKIINIGILDLYNLLKNKVFFFYIAKIKSFN